LSQSEHRDAVDAGVDYGSAASIPESSRESQHDNDDSDEYEDNEDFSAGSTAVLFASAEMENK
jgi:hypothetical protein